MDVLTRERAKPALPFAGTYQLVDFPLSNCAHSGITEVWLSVSFLGATLEEVSNGRPWDLDRSRGGFRLLMPQEGDSGLGDFGDHLVPRLVERHTVVAHPLEGYWRDLGKPEKYLEAHLDVLTDDLGVMAVPGWPVLTRQPPRPPGRVLTGASVEDSLVGAGAVVAGTVVRSVLGPGVVVEAGATVTESVLFRDCVVRAGASVSRAVVDDDCQVSGTVGAPGEGSPTPEGLVLVGRGSSVTGTVAPGARLEPGSSA